MGRRISRWKRGNRDAYVIDKNTLQWTIGIIVVLLMALFTVVGAFASQQTKVTALKERVDILQPEVVKNANDITGVSTNLDNIKDQLKDISAKLDKALEYQGGG